MPYNIFSILILNSFLIITGQMDWSQTFLLWRKG